MLEERGVDSANLPTAIFGTASTMAQAVSLGRSPLRIGLWPVLYDDDPEVALGIAVTLGLLLGRWLDVTVYRLLAQLDGEPDDYIWIIEKSAFGPDDWSLDELDENVTLNGALVHEDAWTLTLEMDTDVFEDDEVVEFSYTAATLSDLINQLPTVANEIVEELEAERPSSAFLVYDDVPTNEATLIKLLRLAGRWEVDLLLYLWGKADVDFKAASQALIAQGQLVGGVFGPWLVSMCMARVLTKADETLVSLADSALQAFDDSAIPATMLAPILFRRRLVEEAYEILETAVETSQLPETWITLAELYRQARRLYDAIDTYQSAIEEDIVSAALFRQYAETLITITYAFDAEPVEEFILIDPDDYPETQVIAREVIAAYREALALDEKDLIAASGAALQLIELEDADAVEAFARLVALDPYGDRVRLAIDAAYKFDDLSPFMKTLQNAIDAAEDRHDLRLNLAALHLLDGDTQGARAQVQHVQAQTDDDDVLAEADVLALSVEIPNFERKLADIRQILDANGSVRAADADFLEDVVERAPSFAEGHLLLARTYVSWKEPSTALETLQDALNDHPDDPELLGLGATLLWERGERETAFAYLNRGLDGHPNHIVLLVRAGQFLFEDEQHDAAKLYLSRAERISPRHPLLREVKRQISMNFDDS